MSEDDIHESRFRQALAFVLDQEGGTSDHAEDPGGFTVKGVTLALLKAFGLDLNKDGEIDRRDLEGMTDDQVADIYRARFWTACRCRDLPAGIDLAVFDCAVNQGPGTAAKLLQEAAGVKADGVVGPATLRAVALNRNAVLLDFCARRALRYAANPKILVFGRGWFRRLLACYARAKDRAASVVSWWLSVGADSLV